MLARHSGLFEQGRAAWAAEWMRTHPRDTEAALLYAEALRTSHAGALGVMRASGALEEREWSFAAGKLEARFLMEDYLAVRSFLDDRGAVAALAHVRAVAAAHPEQRDAELLRWQARLEYDLGRYAEAVRTLSAAGAPADLESGLLLCDALAAAGDRERARQAAADLVARFPAELKPRLVLARTRDLP